MNAELLLSIRDVVPKNDLWVARPRASPEGRAVWRIVPLALFTRTSPSTIAALSLPIPRAYL